LLQSTSLCYHTDVAVIQYLVTMFIVYGVNSRMEILTCTLHSNYDIYVQPQLPANKPNCTMNIQPPSPLHHHNNAAKFQNKLMQCDIRQCDKQYEIISDGTIWVWGKTIDKIRFCTKYHDTTRFQNAPPYLTTARCYVHYIQKYAYGQPSGINVAFSLTHSYEFEHRRRHSNMGDGSMSKI